MKKILALFFAIVLSVAASSQGNALGFNAPVNRFSGGGGSGTPAGSSGDIQTNNAGAFGSFTPGAGVQTFLTTPSSANARAMFTDGTGTGLNYFQNGDLGTPSAGVATNITGLPLTTGVSGILPAANGGQDHRATYVAVTSTYAILAGDHIVDATSGTFTETLPTAVGVSGKEYILKNSGTGVITIATTSSQTIEGYTPYILADQYSQIVVYSDGANWKRKKDAESPLVQGGSSARTIYYNFDPSLMPHHIAALANVKAGLGDERIMPVGDSTTYGSWSLANGDTGDSASAGYPAFLAQFFNAANINAQREAFVGDGSTSAGGETTLAKDARVVAGAWIQQSGKTAGGCFMTDTTVGSPLLFTPNAAVDNFKIWYGKNTGLGVLAYNLNGAGGSTVNTSATLGVGNVTISGTLGPNTLNLDYSSGAAGVFLIGVEAWNSTISSVRILNSGWPFAKSADLAGHASAFAAQDTVVAMAPDVILLDAGINDWANGVSLATYEANMQQMITAFKVNSDVVLVTPAPTGIATVSLATQQGFVNVLYKLAAVNKIPLIDNFSRWKSYEIANVAPLLFYQAGSNAHPNAHGYADFAQSIVTGLLSVGGSGSKAPGDKATNYPSVYGSGTAYSLTATPAAVTFGTTSPALTLMDKGTYRFTVRARLDYNAATFAAVRTTALKLRRTNNTAADLTNCTAGAKTQAVTTVSGTLVDQTFTCDYVTTATNDNISLFGSIDVVPTAGSLDVAEAYIVAARLQR